MALTVAAPSSTRSKSSSSVRTTGGSWTRRTHTRVAMPSIPSPPTNTPRRSRPTGSGSSPPSTVTDPSGSTTSTARMCVAVTPSDRQCGPPAFVATLPPTEQLCWLEGSGRVVHPVVRQLPAEVGVEHSGLDPGLPGVEVDGQDPVHLGRHDDDGVVQRDGPAGQPGPRPAGNERDAVAPGRVHALLDLGGRGREDDHRRWRPPCWSRRGGRGSARWRRSGRGPCPGRSAAPPRARSGGASVLTARP